jgi:hypothetical protein
VASAISSLFLCNAQAVDVLDIGNTQSHKLNSVKVNLNLLQGFNQSEA